MKNRFTTIDIISIVPELNRMLKGYRVHQIYDVDQKTYLIRLKDNPNEDSAEINKLVLLIESGIRIHVSEYDWPKNFNVSGFTLKLRKHLKNKRIEYIKQVGIDRVIDIQFGINEAAYHIIIELYDKGNVIITDYQYVILNLLRSRKLGENDDVKLMVREIYPLNSAVYSYKLPTKDEIITAIQSASPGDTLRKVFNPRVIFGTALLEHCFMEVGFIENWKLDKSKQVDYDKIEQALRLASNILDNVANDHNGIIIHKEHISQASNGDNNKGPVLPKTVITYTEFHPMLFNQHKNSQNLKYLEFESFCKAVDIYFSSIEGQKIDQRALQQEKDALKKLENVKKDHEKRLQELAALQEADKRKASLIEVNKDLVEKALLIMRSAIANQISWEEIKVLIKEAQLRDDVVACSIKNLKLEKNHFTMILSDPFAEEGDEKMSELVDIDLDLSAFGNARRYYDQKRFAAKKEQKTLESSSKALKSAEHKTQQTLKEVAIKTSITKARKVLWFEKFFWFISSENYLVIGGRDAQQNELIVKKYLKQGDIYVHADLHGASSIVVKNHSPSEPVPPKTLQEAGTMAVCYSSAWENKFSSRSWWVHSHQVSKTAPSGEYLTVGAFMIRGKKNYLPMPQLVMGFGFLFRLDEDSIENHKQERRIRAISENDDQSIIPGEPSRDDVEIEIKDSDDEGADSDEKFPDVKIKNIVETHDKDGVDGEEGGGNDGVGLGNGEEDEPIEITGSQIPRMKYQQPLGKKRNEAKKRGSAGFAGGSVQKISDQQKVNVGDDKERKHNQPLKRGQRYKLKKMKEKYKDQDEEDRQFRMALVGSAPINRELESFNNNNSDKNTDHSEEKEEKEEEQQQQFQSGLDNESVAKSGRKLSKIKDIIKSNQNEKDVYIDNNSSKELKESFKETSTRKKNLEINVAEMSGDEEDDEDDQEEGSSNRLMEDIHLINSLTGQPLPDDNLPYTIPVVAPYTSLNNYKFKVKVLPGTNKRGKAAKTALSLFLNDKTITSKEKVLLKNSKDQDIARNLPNKVKISAVNLSNLKKGKSG